MANILYISYDGMTDSLGQSQVIPYLKGLVLKGHSITILSTEKPTIFAQKKDRIQELLSENNITWRYIFYTKKPPILSTLKDVRSLWKEASRLHKNQKFDIIHCRSYISAMIGLKMKRKFGTKFIFDMRGFWADERVDGKIWNLKNPVFKTVYKFFKSKEIDFLENADNIVSLTNNAKEKLHTWQHLQNQPLPIDVIPCCVDIDRFDPEKITEESKITVKKQLGIAENEFILSYLGSIGTWYMLEEMLDFFSELLKQKPQSKFLFITSESKEYIIEGALKRNIPQEKLIITKVDYTEVPLYLSVSNLAIFFILPVFSKSASSPIKQGEIMSMGLPIVCNAGVGDTDFVINKYNCGFLINDFNTAAYNQVISKIDETIWNKDSIRDAAKSFYSLKQGIESYNNVYDKISAKS